jgi:hydrocephalus-inducing protein
VNFTLQTRRLGQIKLPCKVIAVGSELPPTEFILAAKSIGPVVSCKNPDGSLCTSISFGKISVLHAHEHELTLHNESLISAEVTALMTSSSSVFYVDCQQCILQAGESRKLNVFVQADETYTFSDTLNILATNGVDLEIPVSATGIGSTLYCAQAQDNLLDFQHQLAGTPFSCKVVIENHGRRTCNGTWENVENELIKKKWGKQLRCPNGKPDFTLIPVTERAVFSVEPEKAIISAKQCMEFTISGFTPNTGLKEECLQLITEGGQEV